MPRPTASHWVAGALAGIVFAETGCATLVQDTRVTPPAQARHCEGSESVTSTHMAVLPIPLVAFFVPRVTGGAPDSSRLLDKCGGKRLTNRNVTRNYAACVPVIFLTTVISLGIIGVCPTTVHYEADVVE